MLFLVSGASGMGKSTVRERVTPRLGDAFEAVELHHLGSTEGITMARRQELAQVAARRAADLARDGRHLLLSGDPVAPGEIIAAPSAPDAGGIAACILDADAATQTRRLSERGEDPSHFELHIAFADWMREHATRPVPRLGVLSESGSPDMRWDRLKGLADEDPRWRVRLIDTSSRSREEIASAVVAWIKEALSDETQVMRPESWAEE